MRRRSTGSAFPGMSSATLHATGKPIPGMVDWHNFRMHFPKDAVLVRTLSLGRRRIETQLLHFDGIDWHAYTFAWRDDQSDADLVPADGAEKELSAATRIALWQFHEPKPVHVVPQQLVGICAGIPAGAVEPIRLRWTQPARRLRGSGTSSGASATMASRCRPSMSLRPPRNANSPIRPTRSHRWRHGPAPTFTPIAATATPISGGGSVDLRLQFPIAVTDMKAVGVRPTRGDFGLPDAGIIKPGDPLRARCISAWPSSAAIGCRTSAPNNPTKRD